MKRIFALIVVAALLGGVFLFLTPSIDLYIFSVINGFLPNPDVWLILTVIGDGLFIGCFFYLLFRNDYDLLARGLIAGLITTIISNAGKNIFEVVRPEHVLAAGDIVLLGPAIEITSYSMPSGHTMAIYMAIGFIVKARSLTVPNLIMLNIVGILALLSRIVIGVHWPSDCLIGLGLGLLIGRMVFSIKLEIKPTWLRYLILIFYFAFSVVGIVLSNEYVRDYAIPSVFLAVFAFWSGLLILHDGKRLYITRGVY